MTEPQEITFEAGLARLAAVAARLDEPDVSVEETLALLREGRGLEQALRTFLDHAAAELDAIEQGLGVPRFEIRGVAAPPPPEENA